MTNFQDAFDARSKLPKKIAQIITLGHIDRLMFSTDEIKVMKTDTYKDLATQKVSLWNNDGFVITSLGLWGEDSDVIKDDLGLSCVFFNEEPYVIPEHFMSVEDMLSFMKSIIIEHYPEYLV
jgi:hypothetical protein